MLKSEFKAIEAILMLLKLEYDIPRENKDFCALISICAREPDRLLAEATRELKALPILSKNEIANIRVGKQSEHHRPVIGDLWEGDSPLFRAIAKEQHDKTVALFGGKK